MDFWPTVDALLLCTVGSNSVKAFVKFLYQKSNYDTRSKKLGLIMYSTNPQKHGINEAK